MHLGIIMDGTRRWAGNKGLFSLGGYGAGVERVRDIVKWCRGRGIKTLTLYAFSTENWNRPPEEVSFIMQLINVYLTNELDELQKEMVKVLIIGQKERLPAYLQKNIDKAENLTKNNDGLTLVLAISYGGRAEIVEAIKRIVEEKIPADEINAFTVQTRLWTAGLPDPDLIIRTSGEQRISNFLIWQSAYSEFHVCQKYWPDFSEQDLDAALAEYASRQRNFGK